MKKIKIKTGDRVKVISGDHKGLDGDVVRVFRQENKALVEGINLVKKHIKPSAEQPKGGIIEKEAPIHISNLSLLTSKGEATRVGYRFEDDKKMRFSKKSNETI